MNALRFRRASVLVALAALLLAAPSRADAPAAALVRVLDSPGRPHPLADSTGRVPFTVVLPTGVSAQSLGLLEVAPGIGAARLPPAALASFAADHRELYLGFEPPRHPMLDVSRGWIHLDQFRSHSGTSGDGQGVIVGIVDTGIDIHHPDFLDKKGKTRIAWLLNAEPPRGLHPDVEHAFGCDDPKQSQCAIYAAADIDALIAQGSTAIHDPVGHGTHVTSIAAGNGGISIHTNPKYAGVAPGATLVIASPSTDGGFFDADVLRATKFVFDRAAAVGNGAPPPLVCNLSLGGDFGPHDGSSALEHGLTALVGDDQPGRAIVVAAGNSGALVDTQIGDGPTSGIHTEARVTPGGITRVPLRAGASSKGQGFVWITFRPGDMVDVALEGPDGSRWIGFQAPDNEAGYDDKKGTTAGVVNNHVGKSSSITSDTNSAVVVVQGAWADRSELNVLLRGSGEASLWVVGTGDAAPSSSSFGIVFERAIRQGTVTVPASAPGLLGVGCTLNRLQWKPFSGDSILISGLAGDEHPEPDGACYFSASGPTPLGVMKPEISAPGGFIIGAMSSEADPRKVHGGLFDSAGCPKGTEDCFLIDNQHAVAAGTSMSAPHVTGAIALLMQIDPTLTQARVTDILEAGARKPTGSVPYDYQLGPGVLDVEGARQALADEPKEGPAPDLTKSWYTLSSAYAQPDPAFPVWGTIELRRADGTLASGLDGTLLTVSVQNGDLVRPPVKVRHGLFRFAFAGAAGHVGEAVTLDVRYGGVSLGTRTLPIGTDVWTTDGVVDAVGGCAIAGEGAGERGGWPRGLVLAGGLGLVLARRRYRAKSSIARRLTSKSC
ncbi:MAG: S8 family serine peptidase [Byssovorax sp.]